MSTERFIAGIYNYCDYWCERCAFTRRCRTYASSRTDTRQSRDLADGLAPNKDATNAEFWNLLAEQLRETTIFGKSEPCELEEYDVGVDYDGPDDDWLAREESLRKTAERHPIIVMSRDYMKRVHAWLETADGDLKAVARGLMEDAANRFVTDDVEEQARQIGEMIDVVAWYHTLISAKLWRAVRGLMERDDVGGEYAEVLAESRQSDANGSGKIALIGVERSIAAWMSLRGILPEHEDMMLAMLSLLDQIRRRIQLDLPDSVSFLRPGFDGEDVEM